METKVIKDDQNIGSKKTGQHVPIESDTDIDPFFIPKYLGLIAAGAAGVSFVTHHIPALKEVSDVAYNLSGELSLIAGAISFLVYHALRAAGEIKPIDWKGLADKIHLPPPLEPEEKVHKP